MHKNNDNFEDKVIAYHEVKKKNQDPISLMKLDRSLKNKDDKSQSTQLQNPVPCLEIRCGARNTIFEKQQVLDQNDDSNIDQNKDYDANTDEAKKYLKQLKKLGKLGKSLYDTYYDILLGKVMPDQMSSLINQFFNSGDDTNNNYCTERDYHRGDFVIKFPNPDHPTYEVKNTHDNAITHKQKEIIFKKLFSIINRANLREKQDYKIILKAYNDAFDKLQNYYTPKEQQRIEYLKQKIEDLKILISHAKSQERKQQLLNANNPDNPIYQLNKIIDRERERKISFGGQFLEPVFFEDEQDDPPPDYVRPWKTTGKQTADYCTLLRNLFMIRLIKVGFHLRNFISYGGEYIYMVVYAEDINLKITSETDKMKIQIRTEFCDILSFEPVDERLRPLRMSSTIWNRHHHEQLELDENKKSQKKANPKTQNDDLQTQQNYMVSVIKKMLKKINFLQILKETNCQNLNSSLFTYGQVEFSDDIPPNNVQLELYYEYLIYLNEKITHIRSKYYYKQEDAYQINKLTEQLNKFKFKKKIPEAKKKLLQTQLETIEEEKPDQNEIPPEYGLEIYENPSNLQLIQERQNLLLQLLTHPHQPNQNKKKQQKKFPNLKDHQIDLNKARKSMKKSLQISSIREAQFNQNALLEQMKSKDETWEQQEQKIKDGQALLILIDQMEAQQKVLQKKIDHIQKYLSIKQLYSLKSHKILHTKYIKLRKQSILAHEYKKRFQLALTVINYPFKGRKFLKNFWERIGFDPQPCFYEYFTLSSNISFKKRLKAGIIWQGHQLTENGRVSQFSNMERLKLINSTIHKAFNVYYVKQLGFLTSMFALNDMYELEGKSTINSFDHYFYCIEKEGRSHEQKGLLQIQQDIYKPKPQNLIKFGRGYENQQVKGRKMSVIQSFDKNYQDFQTQQLEKQRIKLIQSKSKKEFISFEYRRDHKFLKAKLRNLELIWKFQLWQPWFVPTEQIKDYYGEKIAIYFTFLGFYTSKLTIVALFGFFIMIIDLILPNEQYELIVIKIIFGIFVTIWASYTIYSWRRQEQMCSIMFGTYSLGKVEADQAEERPNFKGDYIRSLENDNLNALQYSEIKKFGKIGISFLLCFSVLICYFIAVLFIFDFTAFLQKNIEFPEFLFFMKPNISLPAIINYILIFILEEFVYEKLSEKLTDQENHQTHREYESNYILKRYIFSFVSLCIPIMTLTILNKQVGIPCPDGDCIEESTSYFSVLYVLMFIINAKDIILPKIQIWWRERSEKQKKDQKKTQSEDAIKKVKEDKISVYSDDIEEVNSSQEESEDGKKSISIDLNIKQLKLPIRPEDKYDILNKFIEEQSENFEEYSDSLDIYGTVNEYMELVMQFNVLILFGIDFPFAFVLAFIWDIAELRTDQWNLMKTKQRPVPCTETSIGIFNDLLELAVYLAILFNSAVVSIHFSTLSDQFPSLISGFGLFLILIITNFVLNFVLSSVFVDIPDRLREIFQRQQYLMKSTIEIFKKVKDVKEVQEQKQTPEDEFEIAQNQNENQLKVQAFLELLKQNNKIVQRTGIYKIFGTILNPRINLNQDLSFQTESEGDDDDKDLHDKKMKLKKVQIIQKKMRKYWIESKVIYQQLYLTRPFILRKQWFKKKFNALDEQQRRLVKLFMTGGMEKSQAYKKLRLACSNCFHVPLVGIYFDSFRRVDKYMEMSHLVDHLKLQRRVSKDNKQDACSPSLYIHFDTNNPTSLDVIRCFDPQKTILHSYDEYCSQIKYYFESKYAYKDIDRGQLKINIAALRDHKWEKIMDDLLSLKTKKCILDKQLQEPFKSPYFIYSTVCERFLWQIEEQKIQSQMYGKMNDLRLLQLIPFTPITSLNPQESYSPQKWIYRMKGRKEKKLMIFIEIGINNHFHYHILKKNKEILISINKKSISEFQVESFCQIEQQFLFPAESLQFSECVKGFQAICYKDQYICTLDDLIKSRRDRNLPYQEVELIYFIDWLFFCLDQLQQHDCNHSCINPWTIILSEDSCETYKLIGVNNLYKYDANDGKIYFIRDIQKYESLFYSNDINQQYKGQTDKVIDPKNEDVYSVAMVVLYMITLGNVMIDMKKHKYDINNYLSQRTLSFIQSYPVIFTLIKQILEQPDSIHRKKPSEYRAMIKNNMKMKLQESQQLIARKRNKLNYLIMRHTKVYNKFIIFVQVPVLLNYNEEEKLDFNIKSNLQLLNRQRQESAGSMNHFLHTCSTYNKLRMYDCTKELYNKVIDVKNIQDSYKKGPQKIGKNYYTTQSTENHEIEHNNTKLFDEDFSVYTEKIEVSPFQAVVFNADFFVLGAKTLLYCGQLDECEEYIKEGENFINCKIADIKDLSEESKISEENSQSSRENLISPQKSKKSSLKSKNKNSKLSSLTTSQKESSDQPISHLSKLEHLLLNLNFFRLIKEWIQITNLQKDNYKTSDLVEILYTKLLKRNHVYITSSKNNLIRLLNTIRIQLMILTDLNNFSYLKLLIEGLENYIGFSMLTQEGNIKVNMGRINQLCKDNIDISLIRYFVKEYNYLYVISITNQLKYIKAYEKMDQVVEYVQQSDKKNCIFNMKLFLETYQMMSDLCVCMEKEMQFTQIQINYVQSIMKKFTSFSSGQNLMIFILDYFEYILHLVEFSTDKEDVIHNLIQCIENIQEDKSGKNLITEFIMGKLKSMLLDNSIKQEIQDHFYSSYTFLKNLPSQLYCRYFRSRLLQNLIYNTPLNQNVKQQEYFDQYLCEHQFKQKKESEDFSLQKLNNSESLSKLYFFQQEYLKAEQLIMNAEVVLNTKIEKEVMRAKVKKQEQHEGLDHLQSYKVRLKVWNIIYMYMQKNKRDFEIIKEIIELMKPTIQKIFIVKFLIEFATLFRENIYFSNAQYMSKIIYKYIMLMSRGSEKTECTRDYYSIKSLIILENLEIHSELSFEKYIKQVSLEDLKFSTLREETINNLIQLQAIFPLDMKIIHAKIYQLLVFMHEQNGSPLDALIAFNSFKNIQKSINEINQNQNIEAFEPAKELLDLGLLSKEAEIYMNLGDYTNSTRLFKLTMKKANRFTDVKFYKIINIQLCLQSSKVQQMQMNLKKVKNLIIYLKCKIFEIQSLTGDLQIATKTLKEFIQQSKVLQKHIEQNVDTYDNFDILHLALLENSIGIYYIKSYFNEKANSNFLKIEKLLNILQYNMSFDEAFENELTKSPKNYERKPKVKSEESLNLIKQHIDYEHWRISNILYLIDTKAVFKSDSLMQSDLYIEYTNIQQTKYTILQHQSEDSIIYGNFLMKISQLTLIILENNLFKSLIAHIHQKNVTWQQNDTELIHSLTEKREKQCEKENQLRLKLEEIKEFSDSEISENETTNKPQKISKRKERKHKVQSDIQQLQRFFAGEKGAPYIAITEETLLLHQRQVQLNEEIRFNLANLTENGLQEQIIQYVEQAQQIFKKLLIKKDEEQNEYNFSKHSLFFSCYLLLGDLYIRQKQLVKANEYYTQAEICQAEICTTHSHPNFAILYYRMGIMEEIQDKIMVENISRALILSDDILNIEQKELIIKQLLTKQKEILVIFDNYRMIGIDQFFHQYLQDYCLTTKFQNDLITFQASRPKQIEMIVDEKEEDEYMDSQDNKIKKFNMSIFQLIEAFDRDQRSLQDILYIFQRFKVLIQQQEIIENNEKHIDQINDLKEYYFRKAFQICKTVWDNKKKKQKDSKEKEDGINDLYKQIQIHYMKAANNLVGERDIYMEYAKIIQELNLNY